MYVQKNSHPDMLKVNMRGGEGTVTITPIADGEQQLPAKCRLFGTITIPAGASIGVHEHVGECEMFYILQGNPVIIDDGEEYTAHPGDCILTHSGHSHGVKNPGTEPVVMVANIVKD